MTTRTTVSLGYMRDDGDFAILLDKIRASYGVEAVAYGVPGLTAQALMRAASRYVPVEGSLLLKN